MQRAPAGCETAHAILRQRQFSICIALEGRAGQRERERRRLRRRREASRRRNTERRLAGKTCSLQLVGFRGRGCSRSFLDLSAFQFSLVWVGCATRYIAAGRVFKKPTNSSEIQPVHILPSTPGSTKLPCFASPPDW